MPLQKVFEMFDIEIEFEFENNNGDTDSDIEEFSVCSGMQEDVNDYIKSWIEDREEEEPDGIKWSLIEYNITEFEDDYGDPGDFSDLDEYAEFAELVEEHGEAYRLRSDDVGAYDEQQFLDEYQGPYETTEEFARCLYEGIYSIPEGLEEYIEWDRVARDLIMDYSVYEGSNGDIHIFRDC